MYTLDKSLQNTFIGKGEVKGYVFELQKRNPRAFVYRVTNGVNLWYEVFKRKIDPRFGNVSYPKSKSFGKWAWTCLSEKKAIEKFNELTDAK